MDSDQANNFIAPNQQRNDRYTRSITQTQILRKSLKQPECRNTQDQLLYYLIEYVAVTYTEIPLYIYIYINYMKLKAYRVYLVNNKDRLNKIKSLKNTKNNMNIDEIARQTRDQCNINKFSTPSPSLFLTQSVLSLARSSFG